VAMLSLREASRRIFEFANVVQISPLARPRRIMDSLDVEVYRQLCFNSDLSLTKSQYILSRLDVRPGLMLNKLCEWQTYEERLSRNQPHLGPLRSTAILARQCVQFIHTVIYEFNPTV
jgi:hypothetical protein